MRMPGGLRRPILIAAFSGWNDAAEAATTAARYLAVTFQGEKFAEIDPDPDVAMLRVLETMAGRKLGPEVWKPIDPPPAR